MIDNRPLAGIFTPNIVPLDAQGEINEAELRRYVDWLIERGVHGLYPNGSTGEFTRFTAEERRRIIEIIADQTRGRVPILAGAAEANVERRLGPASITTSSACEPSPSSSPFYYKLSPQRVYAYFKEIGRQHADRRHAIQHPDVRLADRCADRAATGRRMRTDRRDQGFIRRHAAHDANDLRPCDRSAPELCVPHRLGCRADADVADRLRRRHERHQRRRSRDHAQALRPDDRSEN